MRIEWRGPFGSSVYERKDRAPAPMWPWPAEARWQKCPVCNGRTTVPVDFYAPGRKDGRPVTCKTCGGKGVVK